MMDVASINVDNEISDAFGVDPRVFDNPDHLELKDEDDFYSFMSSIVKFLDSQKVRIRLTQNIMTIQQFMEQQADVLSEIDDFCREQKVCVTLGSIDHEPWLLVETDEKSTTIITQIIEFQHLSQMHIHVRSFDYVRPIIPYSRSDMIHLERRNIGKVVNVVNDVMIQCPQILDANFGQFIINGKKTPNILFVFVRLAGISTFTTKGFVTIPKTVDNGRVKVVEVEALPGICCSAFEFNSVHRTSPRKGLQTFTSNEHGQ